MKLSMKKMLSRLPIKTLLHNRAVLYALCVIALINVVMYANVKDFNSVATMLIIGFLSTFFSKNMIVILSLAIGITYLLNYQNVNVFSEGLVGDAEVDDKPATETEPETEADDAANADADEPKKMSVADIANAGADESGKATSPSASDKREQLAGEIKNDFGEFQTLQEKIITNMKEIEPLLEKAEGFIQKFEKYSTELQ